MLVAGVGTAWGYGDDRRAFFVQFQFGKTQAFWSWMGVMVWDTPWVPFSATKLCTLKQSKRHILHCMHFVPVKCPISSHENITTPVAGELSPGLAVATSSPRALWALPVPESPYPISRYFQGMSP